ncbi:hypothetical protein FBU30_002326 [Linnemannia zychae]|nr:hypothetical protein FBU30_002326 [Linnemannia zychae]
MAPKKIASAPSATNTFFTRAKKPTTAQRVIVAKNAVISSSKTTVTITKSQPRHNQNEDEEASVEEEVVETDEIEEAHTDDDEVFIAEKQQQEQQVILTVNDDNQDEDSLDEEIEQSDEDEEDEDSDAPRRAKANRPSGTKKAQELITRPVPDKVTKSTLPARSTTADNKNNKTTYVAPDVGDIYSGFHQSDLSDSEKMLRQFDLASKYGPCTDMTRLERWERAFNLGLHPPQHVKDLLIQHMNLNAPLFEGQV